MRSCIQIHVGRFPLHYIFIMHRLDQTDQHARSKENFENAATLMARSFHYDATAANESLCTIWYLLVALAPLEAASGR